MSMTKINWYPGHMKKTKDLIKENMQLIDIVLEVVDARIPLSSKNPDISVFAKNKKRVIVLNKSDLVEKSEIQYWKKYFKDNNFADEVLEISAETGFNIKALYSIIDKVSTEKKEKLMAKGLRKVNVRLMVAGIPNVGKSRLINRIVGKNSAGVGNKPGFTKGKQWIRIKDGLELLDTPGILWPKFESDEVGQNLAITGAIRDEILPIEDIACILIGKMIKYNMWNVFAERYKLEPEDKSEILGEILEKVALRNKMFNKGESLNIQQAAYTVLRDYRNCRLGKFGLDR
ncbi:ribosome biogenesis GTPase YlqF [uncultured Fusobacterium sp.]|uniref:ribosome biogenesis GTPase YlqF n=1 Tax=uncultured Fusobacterium sp. TaxID=159267 RepID=UPI0026013052|nr:ribosome biogenesis GTPase YlqF [uncultured Fusobacterium sp.]